MVLHGVSSSKSPGEKTRLPYYVVVAVKEKGYNVDLTINPTSVKVWDENHSVLTGSCPQAVDEQGVRLAEIVRSRSGATRTSHA